MHRIVTGGVLSGAVLAAAALTGCSGPGTAGASPASPDTASSSAAGAATATRAAGEPASGSTSGRSAGAPGKASPAPSRASTDARKVMPAVSAPPVGGVAYAPASSGNRARFAPVIKASGGLLASTSVQTLTVGGRDVGGVAVYDTRAGLAKSPMFQDQYVVQLVNALTGSSSSPRFVRANGQVIALSTAPGGAVAGWFQGNKVVLLYRQGSTPDVAGLALAVRAAPPAR